MTVGCRQEIRRSINRSVSGILFERVQSTNEESVKNQRVRSIRTLASSSGECPEFPTSPTAVGESGLKIANGGVPQRMKSIRSQGAASTAVIINIQ